MPKQETKPGFKYWIPITKVKTPLPKCYGCRCDFNGGPCTGCTIYPACAVATKEYIQLVEASAIPEVR